jgi:alkanesulfonate monooxygenase SsuD/methylene tetrahydromethanopterin reductase-like flavin-dependent oxidoreductase (luciferase family)
MWGPVALAAQAATVGQISEGRFILGLGTGGYGPEFWASQGLPDRPIAIMRDYLVTVRGLLTGETVSYEGPGLKLEAASLGARDLLPVPVYLAALGPQMLRLAGESSDGALLNWATPARIAESRRLVSEGAARTGRDPGQVPLAMYIRVCVDADIDAARRALGAQVLGYAMGRPGTPNTAGYRGLFAEMGFDEVLSDLERRKQAGATMDELLAATPDAMIEAVGYFGPAAGAPQAYARLTQGLDETMVRVVTARRGLESVVEAMEALTPKLIRDAVATTGSTS